MVGAQGWGGRNGDLVFIGDRVSVWENGKVLEVNGGDGCTILLSVSNAVEPDT